VAVKEGSNKAIFGAETKGPVKIEYVGPKDEVYMPADVRLPGGHTSRHTVFTKGKAVEVAGPMAAELLKQPDKFKAVS